MAPQGEVTSGDLDRILKEKFTHPRRRGYITLEGCCLAEYYRLFATEIDEFEVRDDDVWVCTFPKCGTTWTQEMVWCIGNDLDFEEAKTPLSTRFPFIECSTLFDPDECKKCGMEQNSVEAARNVRRPRYIKTHLPFQLLPRQIRTGEKKPRLIYVARNPKDVCISYFHHCRLIEGYRGDFDDFCKLFLGGKLCFAPYWDHILGFWTKRDEPNVLFSKFEDMKANLPAVIRRTADFMGKGTISDGDVERLAEHVSFNNMKTNPSVNYEAVIQRMQNHAQEKVDGKFIRSGETGQWKGTMSPDVVDRFDQFTREKFGHTDLRYA